jgi:2,5-diketo-D-gluconate reductase B
MSETENGRRLNRLTEDHEGAVVFTFTLLLAGLAAGWAGRSLLAGEALAGQFWLVPVTIGIVVSLYAQANDMYLVAYSPLLRGDLGRVPELTEIAAKHDATPAQVSLAWLMSKDNVVPIPKGRGDHLVENFRARDLELTPEDIETIENIDREFRIVDRPKGPWQW